MRTTGRRRLDVVVIAIGALVAGCATAVGGAVSDQERLPQMWVGAELRDDGTSSLTEVIDYDTGLATDRHGIVRRIPGLTVETPVVVQSNDAPAGIATKTPFLFDGGEPGIEMSVGVHRGPDPAEASMTPLDKKFLRSLKISVPD